jgi:hypothetical protein
VAWVFWSAATKCVRGLHAISHRKVFDSGSFSAPFTSASDYSFEAYGISGGRAGQEQCNFHDRRASEIRMTNRF